MVSAITKSTLYNTFDIIKTILKNSTILTGKFRDTDFYEFEPFSAESFKRFPCIVIESPEISENKMFKTQKNIFFSILISLYVEYSARSNLNNYANQITYMLNSNQNTLESYGLEGMEIVNSPTDIVMFGTNKVVKKDITVNFENMMEIE